MKTIVLKVLILGGTNFLGPHLVNELQERGHQTTLFNRGIHNPAILLDIEQLHGDRGGDLKTLEGRHWDAVIDTSGYLPRIVESSSKVLKNAIGHYTFISSISVYNDFLKKGIDETYPVARLEDPATEEINDQTYGALKACCEKVVQEYFPDRCLIIRPGLIVGPLDPTDRFAYWPLRILEGGEVLVPGDKHQQVQFINVRDLAKWTIDMIEKKETGVYNATGPDFPLTFEQLLDECAEIATQKASLIWVEEHFLNEHHVKDWIELPLWISIQKQMPGFQNINCQKAIRAGLTFRPLSSTILSILDWEIFREKKENRTWISREKEKFLLDMWKSTSPYKPIQE